MFNLTGQRFGRLVVIKENGRNKGNSILWECLCDCGNTKTINGNHLRRGLTKSCGCLQRETVSKLFSTHRKSETNAYYTWLSMFQRCTNKSSPRYPGWGGRGITICERWHDFENFFADMGDRPEGLTIERKNNNLGYFKENCCWANAEQQAKNRRIQKNNTTAMAGVTFCKLTRKYRVRIMSKGKSYNIGDFIDLEKAKEARVEAEQKYWR